MTQLAQSIHEPVFVLVDAYRSGSFLPVALLAHGMRCVHVQSTATPPFKTGHYGGPYAAEITNMHLAETVDLLRRFHVVAVIPGSEPGVELADVLNDALGTAYGNGTRLSAARRDKFLMREHAQRHNIRSPRYCRCTDPQTAVAWMEAHAIRRAVVKPVRSAGAQGVRVYEGTSAVRDHVQRVLDSDSMFGERNDAALVEEFIEGDVVIVNAASNKSHYVSDAWRCHKTLTADGAIVFEYMDLMLEGDRDLQTVVSFAKRVLDAFEIRFGPSHTEILIEPSGQCCFVEMAARMHGNLDPSMTVPSTGSNQIVAAALSYVAPQLLAGHERAALTSNTHCRAVDLVAPRSGVLTQDFDLSGPKRLDSFWSARIPASAGSRIAATADLLTTPGSVVLVHSSLSTIEDDFLRVRQWEASEYRDKLHVDA